MSKYFTFLYNSEEYAKKQILQITLQKQLHLTALPTTQT